MKFTARTVNKCRICHRVDLEPLNCHPGASTECDAGVPGMSGASRCFDRKGQLVTRAPKWWIDACFNEKKPRGLSS